jgi:phosphoglycerate dehydrogenase-like enzyme
MDSLNPSIKPRVMVASELAYDLRELLQTEFPEVSFCYVTDPQFLASSLEQFQPQIVFSIRGASFPGEAHRAIVDAPYVNWVQVGGSGYEHLWPWERTNLTVSNCAGVLARHLAETVTGAMLALNGNFLTYLRQQQQNCWLPHEFEPLADQTLLIVGLGHIGRCVADNAKALGMRVIGVRREPIPHPSVDWLATPQELQDLLGEADVVSLHLRLTAETHRLFDAQTFSNMKQNSLFLNTSRGGLVDEDALIAALKTGQLRGAYLDVFEQEPLPSDSLLWALPNVLITPHSADDVTRWHRKFASFFADNLRRWINGQELLNVV